MPQFKDNDSKSSRASVRSGLFILAFGLCILGYLVSIDHPEWFQLRPATGTAMAMAHASDNPSHDQAVQKEERDGTR